MRDVLSYKKEQFLTLVSEFPYCRHPPAYYHVNLGCSFLYRGCSLSYILFYHVHSLVLDGGGVCVAGALWR